MYMPVKTRVLRRSISLAVLLAARAAAAGAQQAQLEVSGANRTIQVSTTEEAERRADTALVHIGYQLYGASSAQVSEQAGAASKAILAAVLHAGVKDDAVESVAQATAPVQGYEPQLSPAERAARSFQSSQEWTVRVAPGAAARVLASAVNAGANQSGGIDWSVADEASLSAEAASKALQHARAVAEQMASGLGAKLGPLLYASNEVQQIHSLGFAGRSVAVDSMAGPSEVEHKKLDLLAPMIHHSASVSAVFAIQ